MYIHSTISNKKGLRVVRREISNKLRMIKVGRGGRRESVGAGKKYIFIKAFGRFSEAGLVAGMSICPLQPSLCYDYMSSQYTRYLEKKVRRPRKGNGI